MAAMASVVGFVRSIVAISAADANSDVLVIVMMTVVSEVMVMLVGNGGGARKS